MATFLVTISTKTNGWVFVYELSGSGFESSCSHLNFRFRNCFEEGVPWHWGNYRVDSLWNAYVTWQEHTVLTLAIGKQTVHAANWGNSIFIRILILIQLPAIVEKKWTKWIKVNHKIKHNKIKRNQQINLKK